MRKNTKRFAVVAAAVVATGTAGIAYAAWTVSGSGTATTKAISAEKLATVDVSTEVSAQLFPGATGDLTLKISNPNAFPVKVSHVGLGASKITSDMAGCEGSATGLAVTLPDVVDISVAAGGTTTYTFSNAVAMSNDSVDACQGATFNIPVTLSGQSDAS